MTVIVIVATLVVTYVLFRSFTRSSLSKIPGPKPSSFLLGNLLELFQNNVGLADFEWQNRYGNVVRFKALLGEDQLFITDPKALHKIYNTSAYSFPNLPYFRVTARILLGKGIAWADGDDHRRQRKVLLPAFSGPEMKIFLGIFTECAELMCTKWMDIISNSGEQQAVCDVLDWLSRGFLDSIGQAAFDIRFETMQNDDHPLASVYRNMLNAIFGRPSAQQIFMQAASKYIPQRVLEWITDYAPNSRIERAREVERVVTGVAQELVREKAESLLEGKGCRDIFSLLIKANMDTEAKNKLSEEELLAQIRAILFAGHETSSNSLSWILFELARHPETQSRLRAEIHTTEAGIRARGDSGFTIADFDAMDYTTAVIKEGLRYHPTVPHSHRIAGEDDVLPLSQPITTCSGEVMDEIAVPKGTGIVVSIAAYNRNKELWGEDAHEFNPDRWLNGVASEKKAIQVGVYHNLMTFSSGTRACMGWRLAAIQIQAFLVEIIGRFELCMTAQSERVYRESSVVMVPVVEGEVERGSQLPLAISVAAREDAY